MMSAEIQPATIRFRVYGQPKGQPRPRSSRFKKVVYDPGTADGWKQNVAIAAMKHRPASPLAGPLMVDVDILLPRPQRLCKKSSDPGELWATCKPDRDNLDKATLDSLTAVGMWLDDAQVCDGRIRKFYHAIGDPPGARIVIREL